MDKWFSNPWMIKGISLVIAVMLFLMVNVENSPQPGGIPGITNGSRVLEDQSLNIYYDEEQLVITEAPESVQVTLRGPQNVLTFFQVGPQDHELYLDLRGKEAGVHYERVLHRHFPTDLSVSIVPMTVRVTLQERQTVSFPVEVEVINEGQITEGYTVGSPSVQPSNIDITAAKGILEQIGGVRAIVDLSGRDGSFQETAGVIVLDKSGNVMELNTDPPAVDINVPITSPNKEVPIRLEREGELPEGIAIDSITTNPDVVTIYGPVDVINDISFIEGVKVDMSEITGDDSYEVEIPVPRGLEEIRPETITVTIDVTIEESREFSNFPIDVIGLDEEDEYEYMFINPEDGLLDLNILGAPNVLERIERRDLQLYVDLEGLSPGDHTVQIQFSGPQNIRPDLDLTNARVRVNENGDELDQEASAEPEEEESEDESEENTS